MPFASTLGETSHVLGHELTSEDWKAAIRRQYGGDAGGEIGQRLVGGEAGRQVGDPLRVGTEGRRHVEPTLSERGLFSIDLYVADARTGDIVRRLTKTETDPHIESLQFSASAGGGPPTVDASLTPRQGRHRHAVDRRHRRPGRSAVGRRIRGCRRCTLASRPWCAATMWARSTPATAGARCKAHVRHSTRFLGRVCSLAMPNSAFRCWAPSPASTATVRYGSRDSCSLTRGWPGRADVTPDFAGGTRDFASSLGAGVRLNAFGYAIVEFAAARPLNRPGRGWVFGFNVLPGF